jgi:hypothetical protein
MVVVAPHAVTVTVDGPVTVHVKMTPGSVSLTAKDGERPCAGDDGALTVGAGGDVVSRT